MPLFTPRVPGTTLMRDFTFVDDIVSGVLQSMDHGAALEVFNLGNNQPELVGFHCCHMLSALVVPHD